MTKYYKYYFQQLAINNKDILDTPEAKAFFFIQDIYNPDSFDNALKSAGKTPALLLERYRTKLGDGGSRNYMKELYGRFNILTSADPGETDTVDTAYNYCEGIAEEILAKMREQLQQGAPIVISDGDQSNTVFFPVQQIEIDQIGPINQKYYGVSVSFFFRTPGQGKSTPAKWPA